MTPGERLAQALHDAGIGPVGRVFLAAPRPGEVPQEVLFVQRGTRFQAVAAVADLTEMRCLFTFGARGACAGFLGDQGDDEAAITRTVDRVSAWLASPLVAFPNALDLSCTLLALLRPVLRDGTFLRATTWGEWDERGPSGTSVSLGGDEEWGPIATAWHVERGVSVRIPGEVAGAPARTVDLPTFEDADIVLPDLVDQASRAVAGWRRFAARPLPATRVADAIVASLGSGWSTQPYGGDWPHRLPSAAIWLRDNVGAREHCVLVLEETERGVVGPGFEARSVADLEPAVRVALAHVAAWRARLTPDKLQPGRRYRVLADAAGVAAGTILRFTEAQYVPYDGVTRYHFDQASLWEGDPASDRLLADLSAWLQPL